MKLGSLFDGSGGFPLAGALFGIEPVWASEIALPCAADVLGRIAKEMNGGENNGNSCFDGNAD